MSRIGNMPITIPQNVTVTVSGSAVSVKGPKGEATYELPHGITLSQEAGVITVASTRRDRPGKALHGFVRAHLANEITGVHQGFTKVLELVGVGYRAAVQGTSLVLNVGFSHPVTITPPPGVTFTIQEGKVVVSGMNKQVVGQVAANVRAVKKPEPYKGKGIRYQGEHIRKKAGKAAKAVGGK